MNSSVEKLKRLIEQSGFLATGNSIADKIVIHGVAGCGKSALTQELIKDNNFNVVNPLSKEEFDISGRYISRELITLDNKINVLDEYLSVDCHQGFQVLLADPFQYKKIPYQANYIKNLSHRFKRELIPILLEIGVEVEAESEGLKLLRGSAYEFEPKGTIISTEEDVIEYVSRHGLEIHHSSCVQGQEFEAVTVYHSKEIRDLERSEVYIALTRVREELRLLQL
uniref:Triple gene block protein 2 n=1 Tax=Banana mild mosaic virus TaxID=148879 RepID=A0A8E5KGK9_9VIRU|nr:triple gene block protein 2 [Banmivirus BanMMV]